MNGLWQRLKGKKPLETEQREERFAGERPIRVDLDDDRPTREDVQDDKRSKRPGGGFTGGPGLGV